MSEKKTIALDLDGVIWDMVRPWVAEYNRIYDDNLNYEDITDYDLTLFMKKCTREDYCHILTDPNFWQKVEPFKGNAEWLEKLNNKYNVVIATKTDYRIFEMKVKRIFELFPFIKYNQIICISQKEMLNVDCLVDDCIDNLNGVGIPRRRSRDKCRVIYDAPYNKDCQYPRVRNLEELYNLLKKLFME